MNLLMLYKLKKKSVKLFLSFDPRLRRRDCGNGVLSIVSIKCDKGITNAIMIMVILQKKRRYCLLNAQLLLIIR